MTPKKLAMILDGRDYKTRSFSSWINGDGHMKVVKTVKKFLLLFIKSFPIFWKSSKLYTTILLITVPLQGILPAFSLWLAKGMIDELSSGVLTNLMIIFLFWLIASFLSSIISPIEMTFQGLLTDKLIYNINRQLMEKSSKLTDLYYFEDAKFYDDIQVIEQEAAWRPVNLMVFATSMIRNGISGISMLFLLSGFHPIISLIILISILPQALVSYRLQREAFETMVDRSPDSRKLRYYSSVMLSKEHAKEVRLFKLSSFFIDKYDQVYSKIHRDIKNVRYKQAVYSILLVLLGLIGIGFSFWWVIEQAIKGIFTPGDILVFSSSILLARQSLSSMIEESSLLYDTLLYMEKFFNFLSLQPIVNSGTKAIDLNDNDYEITFNNVSFKYPKTDRYSLSNINLKIKRGEKIALVGENGAGKTTLIKLLVRFYDPTEGTIKINGVNISSYDINLLRDNMSVVFQDFSKFNLTLRENIAIGDLTKIDREAEIWKAIKNSNLNQVLEKLPNKLDQMLGKIFNGGTDLSGGEWQKVALARAFLRDSPIVILDEPTASLDPRSEHEVFQSFIELSKDKTVFLITHRLSSVKMADKIVVLKDGEIVEVGTHSELIKKQGYYYELYKLQAEKYGIE